MTNSQGEKYNETGKKKKKSVPTNKESSKIIQDSICFYPSCRSLSLLQNLKAKSKFKKFCYVLSLHYLPQAAWWSLPCYFSFKHRWKGPFVVFNLFHKLKLHYLFVIYTSKVVCVELQIQSDSVKPEKHEETKNKKEEMDG